MELHTIDEYPFHQTPTPFHVAATSDVHFNDGYFFGAFDAEHFLAVGMRIHPNVNTVDGFASLSAGGVQRAVRFSRPLLPDYDTTAVGPLKLEFTEHLRTVRLLLEDSPAVLSFALEFRCLTTPFAETPSVHYKAGHLMNDMIRYIQVGRVHGTLGYDGSSTAVDGWAGSRDHSWGVRSSIGPRTPHGGRSADASGRADERRFRLWVPFVVDDHAGFFHTHEDSRGNPIDVEGRLRLPDGTEVDVVDVEHALTYHDGTRYPSGGTITVTDARGDARRYELTGTGTPADVQGFGYHGGWHDDRSAGIYRGHDVTVEHDRYPSGVTLPPAGPPNVDQKHRLGPNEFPMALRCTDTGSTGMAQLEHSVLGTYRPYGFE